MAKTTLDPKFFPLIEERRIASLATLSPDGSPHLTAVWYVYQDGHFFVATSSRSRKARNLVQRPTATIMVEARKPGSELGVTATGPVEVISGEKVRELNLRIHRRYMSDAAIADPQVGGVFAQFDDVTLRLQPRVWTWWDMPELDAMYFSGRFGNTPGYLLPQEV